MCLRWLEVVVEFFEVVVDGCRSLLLLVTTVCYRLMDSRTASDARYIFPEIETSFVTRNN